MTPRTPDMEPALEGIGLTADEESVYGSLLDAPSSSLADLMGATRLPRERARHVLASLEATGLVSRSPQVPARFVPTPPDIALEALVIRKEEQLQRARLAARALTRRFRRHQRDGSVELVEVVRGTDAIRQRFAQLQRAATTEMLVFDKPPYVANTVRESEFELAALSKGSVWRGLYDRQALEVPGQLEALGQLTAAGEQARTIDGLPMKLAVANRRLGLIPLDPTDPEEGMVVVHSVAFLTAIIMLFDALWERAMPIRFDGAELITAAAAHGPREVLDEHIISLLASGLQDQAISHQLGVGRRTVQRHVGQIMDAFGAATRFQAGWIAAKRDERSKRPQHDVVPANEPTSVRGQVDSSMQARHANG